MNNTATTSFKAIPTISAKRILQLRRTPKNVDGNGGSGGNGGSNTTILEQAATILTARYDATASKTLNSNRRRPKSLQLWEKEKS